MLTYFTDISLKHSIVNGHFLLFSVKNPNTTKNVYGNNYYTYTEN